jgi:excisionase family DNA binding protein
MESKIESSPRKPLLLSVPEAARELGISQSKTWQLVKTGALASVAIGRRRLIRYESLCSFINELSAERDE